MRVFSSPPANRRSVGMDITPYRAVAWGLASMSRPTTFRRSPSSMATASTSGRTKRHGPHHSAQKSTRTGVADCRTSASKLWSVISVISPMWPPSCSRPWLVLPVGPGWCDPLSVSLGLQPPLGVDRGHAAGPRGGDRLTVGVVHHIPGGKDPLDARSGLVGRRGVPIGAELPARHDVPGSIELQVAPEQRGVGCVPDGNENAAG